jgi:hypothetical protein
MVNSTKRGFVLFILVYLLAALLLIRDTYAANIIQNPGFESSLTSWSFSNGGTSGTYLIDPASPFAGTKSLKLSAPGGSDTANVTQSSISVNAAKFYEFSVYYKTLSMSGTPYLKIYWYDSSSALLSSRTINLPKSQAAWGLYNVAITDNKVGLPQAPNLAVQASLELGVSGGTGTVWFDEVRMEQVLLDAAGDPITVTNIVDINEPFDPDGTSDAYFISDPAKDFWDLISPAALNTPPSSVWSNELIQQYFFGMDTRVFTAPKIGPVILNRDAAIETVSTTIGQLAPDSGKLVKAGDIAFQPFVKKWTTSGDYYVRKLSDNLYGEYFPAYALTEFPSKTEPLYERMLELLDATVNSQWDVNGNNNFTQTYYPAEFVQTKKYYGGFDFNHDVPWTDASGYTWDAHETDHHAVAELAASLIRGYEYSGDSDYLDAARKFVFNQIPRYGFHKGTWNGDVYYMTEYNPSGASVNPIDDAVDNAQGFVALASAMVAYYDTGSGYKEELLEYARGLLWYMAREFATDGRWYYYGAEYSGNYEWVTYDLPTIMSVVQTIPYLAKAGMDVSDLVTEFMPAIRWYFGNYEYYHSVNRVRSYKTFEGTLAANENVDFVIYAQSTTQNASGLRFHDTLPEQFNVPGTLQLRISKLVPPNVSQSDWTINNTYDSVYTVTPAQLESGVNLPFTLNTGEFARISYTLTAASSFNSSELRVPNSKLVLWNSSGANQEMLGGSAKVLVGDWTKVRASNFFQIPAKIAFPFANETSVGIVVSTAPSATAYSDSAWGTSTGNSYIYHFDALMSPAASSGKGSSPVDSPPSANGAVIYFATGSNDFFEIDLPQTRSSADFDIYLDVLKGTYAGIYQMSIDGQAQGEVIDGYGSGVTSVYLGHKQLSTQTHTVRFDVVDKNPSATSYYVNVLKLTLVPHTSNPASSSTKATLHFDEISGTSAADSSIYSNTGTLQGNASFVTSKFGGAARVSTGTGYVQVSDSNSLDLTTAMTAEAWVNWDGSGAGNKYVLHKGTAYGFGLLSTNKPFATVYVGGSWSTISSPDAVAANEWHHIAMTYSSTNGLKLYVDGVLKANAANVTGSINTSTGSLNIGRDSHGWGTNFSGFIDEARVSKVVRTSFNLNAAYTADADTVLLQHLDELSGTISDDASSSANDGTLMGDASWGSSRVGNAVKVNSGTGYVYVNDNNSLDITDQLSIDVMFNWDGTGTGDKYIVQKGSAYGLGIQSDNKPFITVYIDGSWRTVGGASAITANEWHHMTMTYRRLSATTGELSLSVDGSSRKSVLVTGLTTGYINSSSGQLSVGRDSSGWGLNFRGLLDELNIFNAGKLVTNQVLNLRLDEGTGTTASDSSWFGNNGTLQGDASWQTSPNTQAVKVGSTTGYVSVNDSTSLDLDTVITMQAYFMWDGVNTGNKYIIQKGDAYGLGVGSDGKPYATVHVNGAWRTVYSDIAIVPNRWYHIAMYYTSTFRVMRLYLDKTHYWDYTMPTGFSSYQMNKSTLPLNIGKDANSWGFNFSGKIDEVKLNRDQLNIAW